MTADTPLLHFQFENRQRGGEIMMAVCAAVLGALSLGSAAYVLWLGWRLREEMGEGGDWFLIGGVLLLWFGAALARYVYRQVRSGCAFAEIIEIDDNDVLYRFRDVGGEKRWTEPLGNYAGIQVHGMKPSRAVGVLRNLSSVLYLPRSLSGSAASGAPGSVVWYVLLVHEKAGKTVRLYSESGPLTTPSLALEQIAANYAERLNLARLPMRQP